VVVEKNFTNNNSTKIIMNHTEEIVQLNKMHFRQVERDSPPEDLPMNRNNSKNIINYSEEDMVTMNKYGDLEDDSFYRLTYCGVVLFVIVMIVFITLYSSRKTLLSLSEL
jgi:hypothetical protein